MGWSHETAQVWKSWKRDQSVWLNGRAPDHGSGGCRFESCHGCSFVPEIENIVDDEGFEPSTFRMQNGRSTTELNAQPPSKSGGDAGYRSLYLSHAERALYHLSYTPTVVVYAVGT